MATAPGTQLAPSKRIESSEQTTQEPEAKASKAWSKRPVCSEQTPTQNNHCEQSHKPHKGSDTLCEFQSQKEFSKYFLMRYFLYF